MGDMGDKYLVLQTIPKKHRYNFKQEFCVCYVHYINAVLGMF